MRDEWALILGVSAGTGAAIARALAADPGYGICGFHRGNHPGAAADLVADLGRLEVPVKLFIGEAGIHDHVARGADLLAAALGPRKLKFFVHSLANASIGRFVSSTGDQFVRRQFEKTFESMAHSFVYWVQELVRRDLLAPNAQLLALTNSLHESILRQCGLVLASKAALEAYVRHLAWELGPRGHRVNLLKFPTVMTAAARKVYLEHGHAALEAAHRRIIPAGRMCTLEEVGRFVSLIADERAAWVNGAMIDFTGGMTIGLLDDVLNGPR
jgi:NAD(P)-dependent dehydrogenase (short-subunit alcohol dehydrogenase family)